MSDIVVLDYQDLLSDRDLSNEILQAYGAGSIGAVAIRGIPNWSDICSRTLPLGHKLVSLSDEKLKSLEDEGSMYNAGWSLGKEKMGDTPDFSKASFYFNPLTDDPTPELRLEYPWACPMNIWPLESDIPNFKSNCCEVGQIMKAVAVQLSRHIDRLLSSRVVGYEPGLFYNAMAKSIKAKSRMLYYYPIRNAGLAPSSSSNDNWIAWHNDSGFLTCLAPELFLDHNTGSTIENPEPDFAGLWIAQRDGSEKKICIPSDCMGIQLGECLQIISGGLLVATPHCVRGCRHSPSIARISLPCFLDTPILFPLIMPTGHTREDVFRNTVPQRVPPLSDRWKRDGVSFAEFLGDSFRSYYEWATKPNDGQLQDNSK